MKEIYNTIHANGPITKANLIEITQMKQATVTRHLENLQKNNLVRISQYREYP